MPDIMLNHRGGGDLDVCRAAITGHTVSGGFREDRALDSMVPPPTPHRWTFVLSATTTKLRRPSSDHTLNAAQIQ